MTDPDAGLVAGGVARLRLRDLLARNVACYGGDPAVLFGDEVVTWAELSRRAFRLADRLGQAGLARGSRLAVLQRNGPEIVEVFHAAALLGAVVVPISERWTVDEVDYVVGDAGIDLAFVEVGHPASPAFAGRHVVGTRHPDFAAFRDEGREGEPPEVEQADDPVLQMYTSGTTGRPKGVVISQASMIQNGLTIQLSQRQAHEDVFLTATPLTHAAAGTRVFSLAIDGLAHAILERFTPEAFLDAVERHGVTASIVVPTMIADILDSPAYAPERLAGLRSLIYGAAPTSSALVSRALAEMPCGLVHGYGLTEGCPALAILTAEEHVRFAADPSLVHRLTSIGRPAPGVRFKVADPEGNEVPTGEVGELLVRSTKAMLGYWQRPEATAETLRDGWLATGDVGRQDEDGYLYVLDRKKDMLISGGINVYPSEIERVLADHPAVRDVAVVAAPHERWGEVPYAFVVAPGLDGAEVLRDHCRDGLAGYKQPSVIELVAELPRNDTGKVRKDVLRRLAVEEGA